MRDYKGRPCHAGARWAEDGRLQAALYALAVRELLGLEPVGALYQPIGAPTSARAASSATTSRAATSTATSSTREAFDAALEEARAIAARRPPPTCAPARIRPAPTRCACSGGCAYPGICRAADAT